MQGNRFSKVIFTILSMLCLFSFSANIFIVSAEDGVPSDTPSNYAFVEFTVDAPSYFTEALAIDLVEQKTGYEYTYYVFSENKYLSNVAIEKGSYSVSISLMDNAQIDIEDFVLTYPDTLDVVDSATAIPFEIVVQNKDSVDIGESVSHDEVTSVQDEQPPSDSEKDTGKSSLLQSTIFFFGLFVLLCIVFGVYKYRFNNSKE